MVSPTTVDLTVDSIAVGGAGVGRTAAGQVVFVPRTVPGDRIRVELLERRKRWARGRILEIYEAGPGRVEPPCRYFAECGGCQLQHLEPDAQRAWLRRAVSDTLERIGGVEVPVEPVVGGERRFEYRNRVTFLLRRSAGRVFGGYRADRGGRLIDIEQCPLAEPAVQAAWAGLRRVWGPGARSLPPGGELRLSLRAGRGGAVGLTVVGGRGSSPPDPAPIVEGVPGLTAYWWIGPAGRRHRVAGADTLADRWHGFDLALRPEAFVQVNREVAALIEDHIDTGLGPVEGLRILDLYAGVGLRAMRWALAGADVVAVESSPDAVRTAREAWGSRDAAVAPSFMESTVERALPDLGRADVIVVNPPRGGLDPRVVDSLAAVRAGRLIYVSCDPATLARDVARLRGAWRPERAQPFDAFPQTGHVETVLWLGPVDAGHDGSAREAT